MSSTSFTPVPTIAPPSDYNPQNLNPHSNAPIAAPTAPPPTYNEAVPGEKDKFVYRPPQPQVGAVGNMQPVMVSRLPPQGGTVNNMQPVMVSRLPQGGIRGSCSPRTILTCFAVFFVLFSFLVIFLVVFTSSRNHNEHNSYDSGEHNNNYHGYEIDYSDPYSDWGSNWDTNQ